MVQWTKECRRSEEAGLSKVAPLRNAVMASSADEKPRKNECDNCKLVPADPPEVGGEVSTAAFEDGLLGPLGLSSLDLRSFLSAGESSVRV